MKLVTIYSVGSCNPGTREGCAEALLEYKGRTKYLFWEGRGDELRSTIAAGRLSGSCE